ncbi:hypothetical protein [Streptomyces bauhiniae]|uniref:hypothetical protein n=1 Tax=Streptomyces bauhiniae TaxID=2340725 RepID=UPI0035E2F9B2
MFGALGSILWGYDTDVISDAMLFIRRDIALSPLLEGLVVSGLLVSAMAGGTLEQIERDLLRRGDDAPEPAPSTVSVG